MPRGWFTHRILRDKKFPKTPLWEVSNFLKLQYSITFFHEKNYHKSILSWVLFLSSKFSLNFIICSPIMEMSYIWKTTCFPESLQTLQLYSCFSNHIFLYYCYIDYFLRHGLTM